MRPEAQVKVKAALPYVSRGGIKLAGALDRLGLDVSGKAALDIGASTGGFTDCLLQRGVSRVYAVDVGYGQLAWSLRQDSRVVVLERINARYLKPEDIGEQVDLIVIDVAFISATKILPALLPIAKAGADFILLVKPQFEVGRGQVGKGGVVKDPILHGQAIRQVADFADNLGLAPQGLERSSILGAKGNQEFLLWLRKGASPGWDLNARLKQVIPMTATGD